MNTFNERLLQLIKDNCRTDSEFADSVDIESATITRIRKDKIKSLKITLLQKITEVYQLNPYRLYELLTGETYTERPQGSVTAENEYLKKRIAELENHEAFLKNECKVKNMQIEASYIHMKNMERRLERIGTGKPSLPHHTNRKELIINGDQSPGTKISSGERPPP